MLFSTVTVLALILIGTLVLIAHRDTITRRSAAIASAAGVAHVIAGAAIWAVGSQLGMPTVVPGSGWPYLLLLYATGVGATLAWLEVGLRGPAVALFAWVTFAAGYITAFPDVAGRTFAGTGFVLPLQNYYLVLPELAWLLITVGVLEAAAQRLAAGRLVRSAGAGDTR